MPPSPENPQGKPSPAEAVEELAGSPPEFSAAQVFSYWWSIRVRLACWAIGGAAAVALLAALVFLLRASRQESALGVELQFPGANQGIYPSGQAFSPSDIVSTQVLEAVYRRDNLEDFLPFDEFKDAIALTQSSPELDRLRREYQGKMSDRRLTAAEKLSLNDEFSAKEESLPQGRYSLSLAVEGPFSRWPETLAGKVLSDTLRVWAEQSRNRGLFRFDLGIYSENLLSGLDPASAELLILLDRVRLTIGRIDDNLEQMAAVNGARLVRSGDQSVSVGELRMQLEDNFRYRLSLIQSALFRYGLVRDRPTVEAYVREQLLRVDRESQRARSRMDAVEAGLISYGASRTGASGSGSGSQLEGQPVAAMNESILDEMLALSTRESDVNFRQELVREFLSAGETMVALESERRTYERMQAALAAYDSEDESERAELATWAQDQFDALVAELRTALENAQPLYEAISQRQLQPSMVYTVLDPVYQVRVAQPSLRTLLVSGAFAWGIFMGIVFAVTGWQGVVGSATRIENR